MSLYYSISNVDFVIFTRTHTHTYVLNTGLHCYTFPPIHSSININPSNHDHHACHRSCHPRVVILAYAALAAATPFGGAHHSSTLTARLGENLELQCSGTSLFCCDELEDEDRDEGQPAGTSDYRNCSTVINSSGKSTPPQGTILGKTHEGIMC